MVCGEAGGNWNNSFLFVRLACLPVIVKPDSFSVEVDFQVLRQQVGVIRYFPDQFPVIMGAVAARSIFINRLAVGGCFGKSDIIADGVTETLAVNLADLT